MRRRSWRLSPGVGRAIWWKPQARWSRAKPRSTPCACCATSRSTQEADGHWAQNLWLDGRPLLGRHPDGRNRLPDSAAGPAAPRSWRFARRPSPLVAHGAQRRQLHRAQRARHATGSAGKKTADILRSRSRLRSQRCWPPPTLPTSLGETAPAEYLRDTADTWSDNIERWTYTIDGDLARQVGVEGHYVRIAPDSDGAASAAAGLRAHQESSAGSELRARQAPSSVLTRWPWCGLTGAPR